MVNIVAAFQGMHVSTAKHSYVYEGQSKISESNFISDKLLHV